MRDPRRLLAILGFVLLAAGVVHGSNFSLSGAGGIIPDPSFGPPPGTWNGSFTGQAFSSSIVVPNPVLSLLDVKLQGFHHTWRGDLRIHLLDPNGVSFNLVVRPGSNGSSVGDSGDYLLGDYTFVESGGATVGQYANDISAGTFSQYFNTGTGMWTSGSQNIGLSAISGPAGSWTLVIEDWAYQDTGALTGWKLEGFDTGGVSPFAPSCGAGDLALTTPCPCAVDGAPGRGCENSALSGGASLTATGDPALDTVVFTSSGELGSSLSILLQGDQAAPSGIVFGTGVRCAAGLLKRLYVRSAVAGSVSMPALGDPSVRSQSALLGDVIPSAASRMYQAYYRDPIGGPALCGGATFNVSSAITIVWP